VAIVLGDGDAFHMYAGREGCSTDGSLYENMLSLKDYDPFRRAIQANIVQVFQNIVADPYYIPIPVLPTPESAIIVPLNYQEHKFGAMGVFGTGRNPLTHEDLLIYELFASQFAVALHNARHYHSQRIAAQSSQHLLRAWQRFINLQKIEEVSQNLQQLVEDVPNVTQALVWMYDGDPVEPQTIVKSNPEAVKAFQQLEKDGRVNELIQLLDERRMQPLTLQPGFGQKDPLAPLFKSLRGQQLMLVPIMDSARFMGGILASVVNNRQYNSEDAKLLAASLAHAAGLALERTTLIENMAEKSGRLETILRSISEGIFFVDHTEQVAFCNPQFMELTGINSSEILAHEASVLLNLIASQSNDSQRVLVGLQEAIERVLDPDLEIHEDYPIVEISLVNPERDIHVEFVNITGLSDGKRGWAGIIRNNSRFKTMFGIQTLVLDVMSERIRLPFAQMRGLIQTLNEQHSRFTHRERARFLREIDENLENLGHLWNNFLEMYNLEVAGLVLSREQLDVYEMLQRVLDSRMFAEYRRQIQIEAPARLPLIEVDELRLEQAITNVLLNAVSSSPRGGTINLQLETHDQELRIVVHDQGLGIPHDQLDQAFEPFYPTGNNVPEDASDLGLYLAREIIRRHGGNVWIESGTAQGKAVIIALPIVAGEQVAVVAQPVPAAPPVRRPIETVERPEARLPGNGRRVSDRQPQTIMIVTGGSKLVARLTQHLDEQGYEVIPYRSSEEALQDLNSVRLDLILLDVNLADANGLDICERMCRRTEVPIIMLADEASEPEKVRSLMIGADDYISQPISDDELTARVNVIFKRRRIPDRTREPLDLGSLYIDFARREVFLNNKPLELTRIEYDLLHTLAVNQGQVLTHKQLLEKVWGPEYQGETQYLWVNVSRLRKKLEPTADSPRFIHTQPGVGYVFRP
jgi:DNA-binding response OmpR family regulator/signal transduction histidine kinase